MNDNQDNSTVETEAPDMVNHPPHYTDGPDLGKLECIDITCWMPSPLGNAFKYVWRAGKKPLGEPDGTCLTFFDRGLFQDLEKAKFYLAKWRNVGDHGMLYPHIVRDFLTWLFSRVEKEFMEMKEVLPGEYVSTLPWQAFNDIFYMLHGDLPDRIDILRNIVAGHTEVAICNIDDLLVHRKDIENARR